MWGGGVVSFFVFRKPILSHFMFSLRCMLFPTFLENKIFQGGGGGSGVKIVVFYRFVGGRSRVTELPCFSYLYPWTLLRMSHVSGDHLSIIPSHNPGTISALSPAPTRGPSQHYPQLRPGDHLSIIPSTDPGTISALSPAPTRGPSQHYPQLQHRPGFLLCHRGPSQH